MAAGRVPRYNALRVIVGIPADLPIWPCPGWRADAVVDFASRVAAPRHVLVRALDRESVLLNLETERYFGLDEVGTRMWQLLNPGYAFTD